MFLNWKSKGCFKYKLVSSLLDTRLRILAEEQSVINYLSIFSLQTSKRTSLAEEEKSKVIPFEELGCEEVFYWSQLCFYLAEKGAELDTILPTASEFCEYLQR